MLKAVMKTVRTVWMLKAVMKTVPIDVRIASIVIWPWTHAWKPVTSDGVKRTASHVSIVMRMDAQKSATWNSVKRDVPIVLSAWSTMKNALLSVTLDGVKITADIVSKVPSALMKNGKNV